MILVIVHRCRSDKQKMTYCQNKLTSTAGQDSGIVTRLIQDRKKVKRLRNIQRRICISIYINLIRA